VTKDEQRVYNRAYYLKNRDKIKAQTRRYALENAEQVAAYQAAYRATNKERLDAYREDNKERTSARMKEHYYRDPESHRAKAREWYWNNVEYARAQGREYMREYIRRPESRVKIRHSQRLREWRERGAIGHTTLAQKQARWDFFGGRCAYCAAEATTTDHVIPLAKGGTNWPANLRPACHSCNSSKRDLPLATFLERIASV
jgi:5-methylcytosine-specific restriction endonuclease McrA